ncbi:N-acetylmuramoyl-L-alanine amidase family protein, partial [uncultured Ruminococcus sp.]
MTITNQYLTHNRPYTKRSCTDAIAMHWVANPGTSAMANRNYFQNTSTEVSANYIIGLVGEVICCIPDNEVSWCTNQANGYTVSIECCHPDWTGRFNGATYKSMVELAASLCKKYGLHPLKGGVIRHFDVTGKNCPKWFVPKSKGGSDTEDTQHWHKFLADVAAQMGQGTAATKPSSSATTVKLRYDWKQGQRVQLYKEKTQLFANESATT